MNVATVPLAPQINSRPVGDADMVRLADIVRRRGVRRIAYFHCDHFEPWRPAPGSRTFEQNAEDVVRFADRCAANEYARRLTLFYKAHVPVTRNPETPGVERAAPGDPFGFIDRMPEQVATFTAAILALRSRVGHEFQVHLHHEHFTSNSGHRDPELVRIFADPAMGRLDEGRVEIALRRSLAAIREETGDPLERWFFVHGVWALNASDTSVCNVTDEIALLMRNGGRGDFTFPAGRPTVDPLQTEPFFVRPINAPRGYDLAEAEPERAWGNASAAQDKFFIWASPIRHFASSVDYYSDWLADKLDAPFAFAEEILSRSMVAGDTLWFKTHGHSMHTNYCRDDAPTVFPHDFPPLRRLLGTVFEAGTRAGAAIEFATASEVYDRFGAAKADPAKPFALVSPFRMNDKGSASELKALADRVNAIATEFVKERVAQGGENAPGIGAYYAARTERSEILAPYELRIAELLFRAPQIDTIYEIGSGLGVLPMLLAAAGQKSVGIERDQSRVAAARELLGRVSPAMKFAEDQCELWGTAAPAALSQVSGRRAAIVFTNITSTITDADLEEIIAQAAGFDIAVVDLSRFFVVRDATAQRLLLERLEAAGWRNPAPMTGSYWWFRRAVDPLDDEQEDVRAVAKE